MKKLLVLASIVLALPLLPSQATHLKVTQTHEVCHMFPPNNLHFPILHGKGQMSVAIWNKVLAKINSVIPNMPEVTGNSKIKILPMWENTDVNAYATILEVENQPGIKNQQRVIAMFGGLARHPKMTVDGFALVACHEIGHHYGGYPRKGESFAAAEGQADYYGTAKCLRQVFAGENNVALMSRRPVEMTARLKCNHAFPNDREDAAICMRSAMAGLVLGTTLGTIVRSGEPVDVVSLTTPEKEIVAETNVSYGSTQCRVDTYFRGALCPEPSNHPISFNDANKGACKQNSVYDFGSRPVCWFRK